MLASGDANNARAQFTQAIVLDPDPQTAARAHLGLGNTYTALKPPRFADAIAEYQQASNLDPTGQVGDDARSRIAGLQQLTVTPLAPAASNATPGAASPVTGTKPAGTP
jgi:tetratricopeptide (TPR) repeat protein